MSSSSPIREGMPLKYQMWLTGVASSMWPIRSRRTGAEAVKKLLQDIDLEQLSEQLHTELKNASGQKKGRIVKR